MSLLLFVSLERALLRMMARTEKANDNDNKGLALARPFERGCEGSGGRVKITIIST